jgi:hypothetical protein
MRLALTIRLTVDVHDEASLLAAAGALHKQLLPEDGLGLQEAHERDPALAFGLLLDISQCVKSVPGVGFAEIECEQVSVQDDE